MRLQFLEFGRIVISAVYIQIKDRMPGLVCPIAAAKKSAPFIGHHPRYLSVQKRPSCLLPAFLIIGLPDESITARIQRQKFLSSIQKIRHPLGRCKSKRIQGLMVVSDVKTRVDSADLFRLLFNCHVEVIRSLVRRNQLQS